MKKITDRSTEAFFALLKAGLWEQSVRLIPFEPLDIDALYTLADDQSVVGLIAAGLEHVEDRKITKPEALSFLKRVYALENRNALMNSFIEELIQKLSSSGIFALLVKGQGIAQCYERPLWRASGDIDLLLDSSNYEQAKCLLSKMADSVDKEGIYSKHLGMSIDSWTVELHGTLRCGLSTRINRYIDSIQEDTFKNNIVRSCCLRQSEVCIPGPNNDVIFVFIHFLSHFYKGGIGLRQICDWCRLLWTFREVIDSNLLKSRLKKMGLMSEWRAFSAFAVGYLGMPEVAMPLYDSSSRWKRKAKLICSFILEVGNFGKNRDMNYYKYPYVVRKAISFKLRCTDLIRHSAIFPWDSVRFFPSIVIYGLLGTLRRE